MLKWDLAYSAFGLHYLCAIIDIYLTLKSIYSVEKNIYITLIAIIVISCIILKINISRQNYTQPDEDVYETIKDPYWDIPIEHPVIDTSYTSNDAPQESSATSDPTPKIPTQKSYFVNRYYDEGYDKGYDDGLDDGCNKTREWQYDDDCRYRGKNRRQYQLGYEEGYDDGYSDGYNDSGYNPDEEE